ncbi:MAG TPA: hypothetical protein VJ972_11250 [Anaerolineales bacterium]|nr:hypothetical protein [Anaerolineales bacterium]
MKKIAKIILLFVFLFSLFVPSQNVHADIAPPPKPKLGGLEPFEYQETSVQMIYERVEMEVEAYSELRGESSVPQSRINVTAYFTMHNQGTFSETMQVVFPLDSFTFCGFGSEMGNSYTYYYAKEDSFNVMVNGVILPVQKVITDNPRGECPHMTWAGFDVTFPVDEDVVIRVNYVMETYNVDVMQNIEYILETGAGWYGPIEHGYVIVKFPYTATTENVLSASTPGYQFLYNEVFWSFENLEPTNEDNIQLSIVSPDAWQKILSLRQDLKDNPASPEKWLKLAQTYENISTWHGTNLRSEYYHQKVSVAYEQGIAANPNTAFLYSNYAQFVHSDCCFFFSDEITTTNQARLLNLANKALSLDPTDPIALQVISFVQIQNPNLTFTPPPTISPTATSLYTATPSVTPSATITSIPTETPVVVTVVHTKIVNEPKVVTATLELEVPTATLSLTELPIQDEAPKESSSTSMIFGALVFFVVGVGAGTFWQKRKK